MSYYCVDRECQNVGIVESKMVCPMCGGKSELVNYMDIHHLIDAKRKARKLKETILFTLNMDPAGLSDKLELYLLELAKIEVKTYLKDQDESNILILLMKIHALQAQILIEVQMNFSADVKRLMGL